MILDETFPPDVRVENEADTLIKEGHTVFLLNINQISKNDEEINKIIIRRFQIPKIIFKLSALAYTLPIYHLYLKKSIRLFIAENNIDVIHIHDIRVARSVFLLKELNIPIVLDLHENRPEIMKYYAWVKTIAGKLLVYPKRWKYFERKYIHRSNHIIVVTDQAKEYYQKMYKIRETKFTVLPNTVRQSFYENYKLDDHILNRFKDNFVLLYVGDTGLRRGLLSAIKSVKKLSKEISHILLVIVGKSKDDHILKEAVSKLKIEKYVRFEGWQNFETFQSYISACDIGISPIHRNIHHDTTFANKLFQYMSFGKPILVSDCPPQKELVEDFECGFAFESENADEFSKYVLKLYKEKDTYNTFAQNAKKAIQTVLNWEIRSRSLVNLYKKI